MYTPVPQPTSSARAGLRSLDAAWRNGTMNGAAARDTSAIVRAGRRGRRGRRPARAVQAGQLLVRAALVFEHRAVMRRQQRVAVRERPGPPAPHDVAVVVHRELAELDPDDSHARSRSGRVQRSRDEVRERPAGVS